MTLGATFALDDPSITVELNETATFSETTITLGVDFRIIHPPEIVRLLGNITLTRNETTQEFELTSASVEVRVAGGRVASISGDPETAQWVDAGGEPLGPDDLAALNGLQDALVHFQEAVSAVFTPVDNAMAQAP